MKIIKYRFLSCEVNHGTTEKPKIEQIFIDKEIRCADEYLEGNVEIAKREAYNGQYTIEDDGVEEITMPSQLDIIEAQVTYTAMMTDTLLED